MARNITITIGFVPIVVKSDKATDSESDVKSYTVCTGKDDTPHDPARVSGGLKCPIEACGKSAGSWHAFEKGVEVDGKLVVLSKDEVDEANAPIQDMVLTFHQRTDVFTSTVAGDKVNNLFPAKGAEKTYDLLRRFLVARPDLIGMTVWAPSTKNTLWVLDVVNGHLTASSRCWPEDVRAVPEIPAVGDEIKEAEAAMFAQLVESMVEDFDPAKYRDVARQARAELIASKVGDAAALPFDATSGSSAAAGSVDLVAALQASLDSQGVKAKKKPAKKRTAA